MTLTQWLVIAILLIPLGLVFANRLRMDLAALSMALMLGILQWFGLGMLGPENAPKEAVKAISGFSQPVVITLISLFILTRGLEKSGFTRWLARCIVRLGGKNEGRLIALFAAGTAFLSLFMNNLAAGALLLPGAMEVSRQTGIKPSKLLIPVAYGSLLGGAATYFTTANIIVSDLLRIANPPQSPLHLLDFTPTGGLIALAGIAFLWIFGKRLLPEREPAAGQALARRTGSELEDLYSLGERLWQAQVLPASSLVGKTLLQSQIGEKWGVTVAAVARQKGEFVLASAELEICGGDVLLVIGREEKVSGLNELGLVLQPQASGGHLSAQGVVFIEAILAPRSRAEGLTLKEINFRQRYDLNVVALRRQNHSYRTQVGDFPLALGDSLLIAGAQHQVEALLQSPDFIVIEPNLNDQPVDRRRAILALALILAAVAASVAGAPVYLCMLAGSLLAVLLGVLTMDEAYRAIEWPAIFLIAGMVAVSLAMVQTGMADLLGREMIRLVIPWGGIGLAAGAYLLTALLTQVMGGQVAALVTGPVVISAAIQLGVSPQAVAVSAAIGCSASFLTPLAHPVNVLMIAPANYSFRDFFRAGWMLTILSFLMLLVGLRLFWGL
jgi:di/tricarboxylate transporter